MAKLKQFSNEFDILYSSKNNPWVGGVQCLISSGDSSRGIWGESEF